MNGVVFAIYLVYEFMSDAAKKGRITEIEAVEIRSRWEQVKSVTEGFVQACEQGTFRRGALLWTLAWSLSAGELLLPAEA